MIRNRFMLGVILIAASSAIGWAALFLGGALSVRYGPAAAKIGFWIYALSWLPFGVGFWLSGREGVRYSREMLSSLLKKKDGTVK